MGFGEFSYRTTHHTHRYFCSWEKEVMGDTVPT